MADCKEPKTTKKLPDPPRPVTFMENFSTNLGKLLKVQKLKPKEQQN